MAHQARVGQRVTKQPLHGHTRQCQHRAHCQPQQCARQTDLPEDHLGLLQAVCCKWQTQQAQARALGIDQWQADRPQGQRQPDRQQAQQCQADKQRSRLDPLFHLAALAG